MSIWIKGMDKPLSCSICPFLGWTPLMPHSICNCPSEFINGRNISEAVEKDCVHPNCPISLADDMMPVRYGEWIDTGSGQECSICHEFQPGYDNGRHYCPNCGAKMQILKNK